jgi:uncharacterized protein YndB with AHSA1/START domain
VQLIGCTVYATVRLREKEAIVEVTREVVLEAPLEEVWDVLTDPEQLEEWFSEDGEERELVVEEVETRRRVAYTWDEGHVAIEVEEVETGTRVVVTETGEPGWNAVFALRSLAYAYA